MKKSILISIMILWIKLIPAQNDCLSDSVRFCNYNLMSVLNSDTKQYEKYTKTDKTALQVTIISNKRMIRFIDKVNNYDKRFVITACSMTPEFLIYNCIDQDNERVCSLSFGASNISYELIVSYSQAPIVYKVSRNK